MTRKELQFLLDAYGADPTRWPPQNRAAAMELIAGDTNAARMFKEAQALERLLAADSSPPAPLSAENLAQAIIDRASASDKEALLTEHGKSQATVIPFPPTANGCSSTGRLEAATDQGEDLSSRSLAVNDNRPVRWMAAGVLAASLMLGVLLGGTLSALPVGERLLEPVRMALSDEGLGEIVQLASPADGGDLP